MGRKVLEIKCPHCSKTVALTRDYKGRLVVGVGGLTVGAVIGGIIGAGAGIAAFGGGIAATLPFGIALGAMLGGGGYVVGDKLIDKFHCPSCKGVIKL